MAGHTGAASTRTYPARPQPVRGAWYLKYPSYTLYMIREFTPLFMTAWLIWFLYDCWQLSQRHYQGHVGDAGFVVFSFICLIATLYHAITFLQLSGLIIRIPLGGARYASPLVVQVLAFGGLVLATAIAGIVFVYLGTVRL